MAKYHDSVVVAAAMAHLNLTMIHPFKDGNGRMARALQTLVLAREAWFTRSFPASRNGVGRNTQDYYDVLADVGQGEWNLRKRCAAVAVLPQGPLSAGQYGHPAPRGIRSAVHPASRHRAAPEAQRENLPSRSSMRRWECRSPTPGIRRRQGRVLTLPAETEDPGRSGAPHSARGMKRGQTLHGWQGACASKGRGKALPGRFWTPTSCHKWRSDPGPSAARTVSPRRAGGGASVPLCSGPKAAPLPRAARTRREGP